MLIIPVRTPILKSGDDLATILLQSMKVEDGDILVLSSKAVATVEGAAIDLQKITSSKEAEALAKKCNQDPRFTQAVLDETDRLHGKVLGTCPWALLTELRPSGMKVGRILCPNAGLDQSNIVDGFAVGWPLDPVTSVRKLRSKLMEKGRAQRVQKGQKYDSITSDTSVPSETSVPSRFAVVLSDSCCRVSRLGVTAFALTVSGIDPLQSEVGKSDLFGKKLKFTHEAVADQLAVAANAVMGNANQATPAAIIRAHPFKLSNYEGWVEGIRAEDDLFKEILR